MNNNWEALVTENMGLVYMVARKYLSNGQELDDMVSLGKIGLVKAAKGFDAARGTKFSTYAVYLIKGEILAFLRDDGPIKVSRDLKKKRLELEQVQEAFLLEFGYEPTVSEIAKRAGMSMEDVSYVLSCQPKLASLEEAYMTEDQKGIERQEAFLERMDMRNMIEELPKEERMLMILRYYRNCSQAQTAQILKLSQSKVSRLEKTILQKLKEKV